jgi:hypothetical protein
MSFFKQIIKNPKPRKESEQVDPIAKLINSIEETGKVDMKVVKSKHVFALVKKCNSLDE